MTATIKRDIPASAEVNEVGTDCAALSFPKLSGTSYYLVHLFEVSGGQRRPVVTYKINPNGTVADVIHLRTSVNDIRLSFRDLQSASLYEAEIEAVRNINNLAEVVTTMTISFSTSWPTGFESPVVADRPFIWYVNGALHLRHLQSYRCRLTALSGQVVKSFSPISQEETHPISLPPGIYILAAQKNKAIITQRVIINYE